MDRALAMTPDDFAVAATVSDDDLDVRATISTEKGFSEKRGLLKVVWNDNFLRGFIDKKTGALSIQVYQRITYTARSWRFYSGVNYETPDGPAEAMVDKIGSNVDCSNSRYGGCTFTESFGFNVPEAVLRKAAAAYQPGAAIGWKFKYKARAGEDWPDGMLASEVAGFLKVVDNYRRNRNLPTGG